ncbi:MAG: UPF0182 family protein [Brevinema sp.]
MKIQVQKGIVITLLIILLMAICVYLSAYFMINLLWLHSQNIIQSTLRLIIIRWISIPVFALIFTVFSFFHLISAPKKERGNKKFFILKTTVIFIASLILEYFLQLSPAILNVILGGYTGVTDSLTGFDFSFFLFILPLIKKSAIFLIIYTSVLLVFRFVFYSKQDKLHFLDKILLLSIVFCLFTITLLIKFEDIHSSIQNYIGYLDIYGNFLPLAISLIVIYLFLVFVTMFPKKRIIAIGTIMITLFSIIANTLWPIYLKKFIYTPNQSAFQEKFAGIHAESTRKAFGLQTIIRNNNDVIKREELSNVLAKNFWQDEFHFLKVIQQNQEVLPIFNIYSVSALVLSDDKGDIAPYLIAARESIEDPNALWDIKHFRNIFGYGAVIGAAHLFDNNGFSQLVLKDLELHTNMIDLPMKNAHIFFSEYYDDYIFINTTMPLANFKKEGFPLENQTFEGIRGIPINFFTKILLAFIYWDSRFILTDYFLPETQFIFKRKPTDIAKTILPDFHYSEPALIYHNQELWWEMDAYTVSDSIYVAKSVDTLWGSYNWVQSPMKVFVSAYSGEVIFDVLEENNPYIRITKKLYPELFSKKINLPTEQYRYPKELFQIQSALLQTYHDMDAAGYYSEINKREINAQENFPYSYKIHSNRIAMQQTYNPTGKSIFAAQFLAYIDHNKQKYISLYEAPSSLGIPGAGQALSFLNQDSEFSRMATLWGQVGSKLSPSQVTFYPIENKGIYTHTIFLEAEGLSTPLAAQFTVIDQTSISLGHTINQLVYNALQKIGSDDQIDLSEEERLRSLLLESYQYYLQAEQARITGNTQEYKENVDKIGVTLQKITDNE